MADESTASETRRQLLKSASALTVVGLAGCSGTETQDEEETTTASSGEYGGTLIYSSPDGTQELDPHYMSAVASSRFLNHIYETLFIQNDDLEVVPNLVEDWSLSEENTLLTLELPEGVMFHPPISRELVAEDVVESLRRIKNDETTQQHSDFQYIDSIEAEDEYTVEITMEEPFTPLIYTLSTPQTAILPPENFEKAASNPIGTGPFQFDERDRGNVERLTKFEDYRQDKYPYLDVVESRPTSEPSVRLNELQNGDAHTITTFDSKDRERVENDPDLSFEPVNYVAAEIVTFQTDVEPFDDRRVRRAISYAVDKNQLIEIALNGFGETAVTDLSPESPYALDEDPLPQNFEQSRSLLEEAGYGDGFDMTFKLPQSFERSVRIGPPVKQSLSQVGINCELQQVTWDNWINDVLGNTNYEMTTVPHYATKEDPHALHIHYQSDGWANYMNYSNEEVDELFDEGAKLQDGEDRINVYHEAQRLVREDMPAWYAFYRHGLYARRNSVKNQLTWGPGEYRLWKNWLEE